MTGVGRVLQVGDGVARVYGLRDAMMGEMIEFPDGVFGLAHNLEEDNVGCILLGEYAEIKEGDVVKTTGRIMQVPVGERAAGSGGERAGRAHRRQGARSPPSEFRAGRDPRPGRGASASR